MSKSPSVRFDEQLTVTSLRLITYVCTKVATTADCVLVLRCPPEARFKKVAIFLTQTSKAACLLVIKKITRMSLTASMYRLPVDVERELFAWFYCALTGIWTMTMVILSLREHCLLLKYFCTNMARNVAIKLVRVLLGKAADHFWNKKDSSHSSWKMRKL